MSSAICFNLDQSEILSSGIWLTLRKSARIVDPLNLENQFINKAPEFIS